MTFKGLQVLRIIIKSKLHNLISFVNIGRDKGVQNDYSNEILALCKAHGIAYYYRGDALPLEEIDYIIAISWRWMISTEDTQLIVLHDSLLPKYRGFAPLVSALKNGEPKIGVTALFASDKYDEGPIIAQKSVDVEYPLKINDAIELISELYQDIAVDLLKGISSDTPLASYAQNDLQATYSLWLNEDDYFVNWDWDAAYIERFVNATGFPFDGAKALINNRIVSIKEVQIVSDLKIENRTSGKVIYIDSDGKPAIVCGRGIVMLNDAIYLDDETKLIPFNKFRTKFQ